MKFKYAFAQPQVSLEKRQLLEKHLLTENISRCKLFARIVFLFEAILIIFNVISTYETHGAFKMNIYLILYLLLFTMSAAMLIYMRVYGKRLTTSILHTNRFQLGLLSFVNFFLIWGAVVTLVDQREYGHVMAFVVNFMCVSILFHASNRTILRLYVLPILVLFIGLPFFQPSSAILMGHYINLVVFLFFCWLASRMLYTNVSTNFFTKLLLTESNKNLACKIAENEKINEELAKANEKLKKMTLMDELTGIPNRRGFQEYFRETLAATTNKRKLSLMMIDIDAFKLFNDNYGHLEGDYVIQSVAQGIQRCMNSSDRMTARFGGEEFVVAAYDLDDQEVYRLAESIRMAIMELNIPHAYSYVLNQVTISVGIATGDVIKEEDVARLLGDADRALYLSKSNGRNRVEFCETVIG